MSGHSPAAAGVPAPRESILSQALRGFPAGTWVELSASPTSWTPATEFERAGWRAIHLDVDTAAGQSDPLACIADSPVHWMAVHDSALATLASWQAGVCRPLIVLVRPIRLALAGLPQPAWQDALVRNGYVFTAADDDYAYFVRNDQPTLQSRLAYSAPHRWRAGLHASPHASRSWKNTKVLRWLSRLRHQPRLALGQLGALAAALLSKALPGRPKSLLGSGVAPAGSGAPAEPPVIHPNNIVGQQFKTLLLAELDRGMPPSPR